MTIAAGIIGTGVCLPEGTLDNQELADRLGVTPDWIFQRTGINVRHIAAPEQLSSDMAISAARQAMEHAGITPDEVGLIILATSTPDALAPATAALIQSALNTPGAMCYDISAGCSGFVYGIITACHLIDSGFCSKGLVIGAEKFSRVVDKDDPGTAILFGDGAGAVVVGKVPAGYGLMASDTGSDGSQFEAAWIPGGMGSRPAPAGCPARPGSHLRMDGHLVFEFAMRTIGDSVRRLLDSINLNISDVNLLIPHQANQRIVEAAAGRINFPMKNVFLCLDKCGNTSAASIPIAIHYALAHKRIYHKSIVALVGFGGGLSWGSCLYCWYNPEFVHHKNLKIM